jgi:hypothetical protein
VNLVRWLVVKAEIIVLLYIAVIVTVSLVIE